MSEFHEIETNTPAGPATDTPDTLTPETAASDPTDTPAAATASADGAEPAAPAVDPVRSAAGRLGGQRVHHLAELGKLYEQEHHLTPGRQRLKQLIQLGRRYEQEHGLRVAKPRRKRRGDAWPEFVAALARVVKPAYRPAVEQLVASLRPAGQAA